MNASLTVVVPAFDEADALPTTMPEFVDYCAARGWQLIVVNDGSTDSSAAVLGEFAGRDGVTIVTHKVNRGYGGALKSGIRRVETDLVATVDADGQHHLDDVVKLYELCQSEDCDMVVGDRGPRASGWYREIGKWIIRRLIRILLPVRIRDVNSGMKVYRTDLAQRYLPLCPDSMAFSDIITLIFISERRLVREHPIRVRKRASGESTISTMTAIDTVFEVLNIITLFNPMRLFLPIALVSGLAGVVWGLPILLEGRGVSVGAMLGISTGTICFFLGLIAEQLASIRKSRIH